MPHLSQELLTDRLSRLKLVDSKSRYRRSGDAIPGSILVLKFCRQCGLAIRVPRHVVGGDVRCRACGRHPYRPTAA